MASQNACCTDAAEIVEGTIGKEKDIRFIDARAEGGD